jgi:hypothetical protein
LHLKSLKKLAVVDFEERATVKYLDVGEDVVCAAGAEKLVVVVPTQKIIQRWSLETFERETVKTLDIDVAPTVVAMGAASAGPVFVGGGENHRGNFQLLDLKTLKSIPIVRDTNGRQFEISANQPVRVSADGHTFATWRLGTSPSGFFLMQVTGSKVTMNYEHTSVGYITPSPDGMRIYTAQGIFTPQIKPIGATPGMGAGSFPVPAVIGRFFTVPDVSMRQGDYSDFHGRDAIPLDQRFFFHPTANVLATLPMSNDAVVLRELNLDEELDRVGVDYFYVSSQPPRVALPRKTREYQILTQ